MSRLLIHNGRVVDPGQGLDQGLDVLVEDGMIARLDERIDPPEGTAVLDAADLVVVPGLIDIRAHLGEPGREHCETIASACRAAVAGGYTAIAASPASDPVNDSPSITRFLIDRAAGLGLARVLPIGAVTRGMQGLEMAEIGELVRAGAVAVGDDGVTIRNSMLVRRALEYARSFGVAIISHAEDPDLAAGGCMHEGEVSTRIGLHGIAGAAETVMVARDLQLARLTGGRLHLAHLSAAAALEDVRQAKVGGADVTCDVGAAHLCLTDEDVAASCYDPRYKLSPPVRSAADREAVLQAVYDGTVDAIASDHQPRHSDEKLHDFADAPSGAVGLETTVGIAIDRLLHGKLVSLDRLVRLLSTNPARILGQEGGTLGVGSAADITLLDLRSRWTVSAGSFASASRNTPFDGLKLRGRAVGTVVGGRMVWSSLRKGRWTA